MIKKIFLYSFIITISVIAFCSCDDEEDKIYSPKPRGYFRIDFPQKKYRSYDSIPNFSFDIPEYSYMVQGKYKGDDTCWLNLEFPKFKATLNLTYRRVDGDLNSFLNDSRWYAIEHEKKATGLDESPIIRDSAKVYGLVYDIAGNTASSVQFYITDSTRHFMRGSLYFKCFPNTDSLKIVIDFIRKDILQLVKTCKWKPKEIPEKENKRSV
jgi:gliding motility-associated lipoprotein GldD